MTDHSTLPEWRSLTALASTDGQLSMATFFQQDETRFDRFSSEVAGLFIDYSKTRMTDKVLDSLLSLATACDVEQRRGAMFRGEKINATEDRAVLHVALRDSAAGKYKVNGKDVMPDIQSTLSHMEKFCTDVHEGDSRGYTGKPLTTVVNIGIGGSDLGPLMVTEALKPYGIKGRRTYFVSNIDATHLMETLKDIDPETTLFVIASKTFTTQETMTNAQSAKEWFLAQGAGAEDIAKHFIALSTNKDAVVNFGIREQNMFPFWDWVGGRYSLWSAIGMSIALQLGWPHFRALLDGAAAMDRHFETAPLRENMPLLLGLIGVWHRSFLNMPGHAVLPYDQYLHRFPAFLQQADMESNGKRVTHSGEAISYPTGPLVFGEPGTNGQHAFYQLLHQGTDVIPCDFIGVANSHNPLGDHHEKLLANFLAQPEALMRGRTASEVSEDLCQSGLSQEKIDALIPHKVFPGNRPSISILMEKLDPSTLGALIALYEHRIFCQSIIWDINAFDQWGVELGKSLAKSILPSLQGGEIGSHDSSTAGLLKKIKSYRG
ncbi:MAG: glucose-6-phosphate isomerase [Pseudomonadota bacterium]